MNSIRTVTDYTITKLDRDGNPFESDRTAVEFWTDAEGASQQGKAIAAVLRQLKLVDRRVEPLHVEQAFNAKGFACGFRITVTVA